MKELNLKILCILYNAVPPWMYALFKKVNTQQARRSFPLFGFFICINVQKQSAMPGNSDVTPFPDNDWMWKKIVE